MSQRVKGLLALVGLAVVLVLLLWAGGNGPSRGGDDDRPAATPTSGAVALTDLPREAAATYRLIENGGPFPYDRDGVVFRNAERLLPPQPRGYYHEYTVPTPGSQDRGARRIVVGDEGEVYYTEDHYRSFVRVDTG
ncbi:MAG: ribonuclease [Nocardioidaceae bacterium]|nr:ribonuclease [Nocardioidaceae bacterium]